MATIAPGVERKYLGLKLASNGHADMSEPPLRILLVEDDPAYA